MMQIILLKQVKSLSACLIMIFALSSNSYATNYTWNGSYGLWDAPHNWMPYGVPGAGDLATIPSGAARVQFLISVNVGRVIIEDEGELRIYEGSTLTVLNNTNGAGIQNDGSLLVYGILNIESIPSANGMGIRNDGAVHLTSTAECNMSGINSVALFNNVDFVNYGDINISNISSHGVLNYGSIQNRGDIDIEISPTAFTWGIINFQTLYNFEQLSLRGLTGSLDLGGILNTSSGELKNYKEIWVSDTNGTGIKNIGTMINKQVWSTVVRIDVFNCGKHGMELWSGSDFTNEYFTYVVVSGSENMGMLIYGSATNYGSISIKDSQNTGLQIGATGNFTNKNDITLDYLQSNSIYTLNLYGTFFNHAKGKVEDYGRIRTNAGSSFINEGAYLAHSDSNHIIGEDIYNNKLFHDKFGYLTSDIISTGIIASPYANIVQIGIPAFNFLDIASSYGMDILPNVYADGSLFSTQIAGSYNSQNNSFLANANADGLTSVFVHVRFGPFFNKFGVCEIMLPAPINFRPEHAELSLRNGEESTATFNIYPVPASQTLFLEHEFTEAFDYAIFNTLGQMIEQGRINETQLEIDHLPNGQYFLKVESEGQSFDKKFIKI